MSNQERAAWTEVVIAGRAILVFVCTFPVMGNGAFGWFGLLGLLPLSMYFIRPRGTAVIVDERDQGINLKATFWGVQSAWMLTFMTLIAFTLWHSSTNQAVPTRYLNGLIWIQFAACYLIKGVATIVIYRGQRHAA